MTKKEKQKKVLEALDLRVNDVIMFLNNPLDEKTKFRICELEDRYCLSSKFYDTFLEKILMYDYKILEYHQKTYGEYKCNEIHCAKCPLNVINCRMDRLPTQTLYECLNTTITDYDSKIYKACCDELDKVVEDENKIIN